MVLFDNFFNNLSLIVKLYERDLNGIDTAQKDRKGRIAGDACWQKKEER